MDPYIGIIPRFFFLSLWRFTVPDSQRGISVSRPGTRGTLYIAAVDHTASKMPDPIRTPQQSDARPGQYWAGGLPGNSKELTALS